MVVLQYNMVVLQYSKQYLRHCHIACDCVYSLQGNYVCLTNLINYFIVHHLKEPHTMYNSSAYTKFYVHKLCIRKTSKKH